MATIIARHPRTQEDVCELLDLGNGPEEVWFIRVTPAYVEVKCNCGAIVHCSGFTSTCDVCGADYDWNGYRLAPRSQWGEETGETADEILRGVAEDALDW